MRNAVIFDLDGTLSDHSYRVKFAKNKDYGTYYSLMHKDGVIEETAQLVRMYEDKGYTILMLTGRPENYRQTTLSWLQDNGIKCDLLVMRPDENFSKADKMKSDLYHSYIKPHFNVRAVFDDDPIVTKMFDNLNIRTFQLSRGE